MNSTETARPTHVALRGADSRLDFVIHENGTDCLIVATYDDGNTGSFWVSGADCIDRYREDGMEDTREPMSDAVRNTIAERYPEKGGAWPASEKDVEKVYWYVVEGTGEFPHDMLRRDGSRAATEHDQALIDAEFDSPHRRETEVDGKSRELPRRVKLLTTQRGAPKTERWESFVWKVVELDPEIWWSATSRPVMGRPRRHPEGTTAADRAKASVQALKEAGGARRSFNLSPEAIEALETIRQHGQHATDRAAVEDALIRYASAITNFH